MRDGGRSHVDGRGHDGRKGDVNHLIDLKMNWEVSSKHVEGEN
jgi:hypothetical protein